MTGTPFSGKHQTRTKRNSLFEDDVDLGLEGFEDDVDLGLGGFEDDVDLGLGGLDGFTESQYDGDDVGLNVFIIRCH